MAVAEDLQRSPITPVPPPPVEKGRRKASLSRSGAPTIVEGNILRKSPRLLECSQPSSSTDPTVKQPSKKPKTCSFPSPSSSSSSKKKGRKSSTGATFVGDPISIDEAQERWPWRYEEKGKECKGWKNTSVDDDDDAIVLNVKCHYAQANIIGCIIGIGDSAYIKGEKGRPNYIGRILELFETLDGEYYFTARWFFRAEDTVMKEQAAFHDKKRLFYSDLKNDNLLDCIVSKVEIVQVDSRLNKKSIPTCDFYYDMKYSVDYSSFHIMVTDNSRESSDLSSSGCPETVHMGNVKSEPSLEETSITCKTNKAELSLLDLYSGCGAMSTGLCLGAKFAGINLITRWTVDHNEVACKSVRLNHPETQVRNETAEDFLKLLKEWVKLCKRFANCEIVQRSSLRISKTDNSQMESCDDKITSEEFEVSRLVDICYGDPTEEGKRGLKFKVRWKGYGPSEDTWESIEELSKCQDAIRDFVRKGFESKIFPLPGDVDVICGGPPCQGISGFNRYRNFDAPLEDERNHQIVVFMDIVKFLRPKFVLMENVVDILRFADGHLGRYALSRLVHMNYQAKLGIMAAGCYGLPQFRMRMFLWGAHSCEMLPQFPLPTHDVVLRGGVPSEFERNTVAYDEDQPRDLEKAILLCDAISDLPAVTNDEIRDAMPYGKDPETEFQRYIRSTKNEMTGSMSNGLQMTKKSVLYDHRPMQLNEDDYCRVCKVPKRKGANFRDFPGVIVGADNKVMWDPTMERVLLPSGKPLVPEYSMKLEDGKSKKPFSRLWWDETVTTVVTKPNPHQQVNIHPVQDRILTVRECARLQGFPDYYRLCGTVKDRYCQVGNAVAVSVARALGYSLGMAWLKLGGNEQLLTLPPKFSHSNLVQRLPSSSSEIND